MFGVKPSPIHMAGPSHPDAGKILLNFVEYFPSLLSVLACSLLLMLTFQPEDFKFAFCPHFFLYFIYFSFFFLILSAYHLYKALFKIPPNLIIQYVPRIESVSKLEE